MTNQEILLKAFSIATERGYEFDNLDKWDVIALKKVDTVRNDWYQFIFTFKDSTKIIDAERIIFDQSFAESLWGSNTHLMLLSFSW